MTQLVIYGELSEERKETIKERLIEKDVKIVYSIQTDFGPYIPSTFIKIFTKRVKQYVGGTVIKVEYLKTLPKNILKKLKTGSDDE